MSEVMKRIMIMGAIGLSYHPLFTDCFDGPVAVSRVQRVIRQPNPYSEDELRWGRARDLAAIAKRERRAARLRMLAERV